MAASTLQITNEAKTNGKYGAHCSDSTRDHGDERTRCIGLLTPPRDTDAGNTPTIGRELARTLRSTSTGFDRRRVSGATDPDNDNDERASDLEGDGSLPPRVLDGSTLHRYLIYSRRGDNSHA